MNGFMKLTWTEIRLMSREPAAIFFNLAFPIMMLLIFGAIFGNDASDGWYGRGPMDISVPGYMAMIIGTTTMMTIPVVIGEYRQHGILRRLRATPIHPGEIIGAQTLMYLILTALGMGLLMVGGKLIYNVMTPEKPGYLALGLVVGFLCFVTIGMLLGGSFKSARTSQLAGNLFYFPQLFLSGATFPRELFPKALKTATEWLPMTQLANVLKQSWLGHDVSMNSILYLAGIFVIGLVLAMKTFRWE